MWALVESNSISKIYARPTALELNGIRHPANIFNLWTEAELKAIGLYEITVNSTNFKDKDYYYNTDITYTYNSSSDTVTGAYGTATAKSLNNTTSTDPASGNQSTVYGLKTLHKNRVNSEANSLLEQYDWYTLRAIDGGTAVPSEVATYRTAVRTAANSMTTKIDNAADVDALAALYEYSGDPLTRPLGEFPDQP